MWINVTQRDIDEGEQGSCTRCPIALALKRHTGERWIVRLGILELRGAPHVCFPVSQDLIQWIAAFDSGLVRMKPFSFAFSWEPPCS